jgi:hypothetical protein
MFCCGLVITRIMPPQITIVSGECHEIWRGATRVCIRSQDWMSRAAQIMSAASGCDDVFLCRDFLGKQPLPSAARKLI